jgi:hypothetical protein
VKFYIPLDLLKEKRSTFTYLPAISYRKFDTPKCIVLVIFLANHIITKIYVNMDTSVCIEDKEKEKEV